MDSSNSSSHYVHDTMLRVISLVATSREIVAIYGYFDEPGQALIGRIAAVREDSLDLIALSAPEFETKHPIRIDLDMIERIERDSVEILAFERNESFANEDISAEMVIATEDGAIYQLLLEAIRLKRVVQITTASHDRFFAIPESLIGRLMLADRICPKLALRDANLYVPLDQVIEVRMKGAQESILDHRMAAAA